MNRVNFFIEAKILVALSLISALLSFRTYALPTDKNEIIRGSADNLVIDQKNGLATYTGSVRIEQGSLLIFADSIVVHTKPDSSIEKLVATGNPALFQQQIELNEGVVKAAAKAITYTPDSEHLLLVENASVEQNGAVMSGPYIDYDLVKEVMKANSGSSAEGNNQRIEIVIPPKNAQNASSSSTVNN